MGESIPIPAEIPTPQKEVTPVGASQTRSPSPISSPVIFASNPFVGLSQAIKDVSFLVVTPSSIPSSATHRPDVGLSFDEGSKEVFEDYEDEPITKKRVSDSDEDDSGKHETEAMSMRFLPLLDFFFLFFFFW